MSKAQQNIMDAIATITGNTSPRVSTIDQLRKEARTQRAGADNLANELVLNADAVAVLKTEVEKQRQRADTAESELATLRRQVAALLPKPKLEWRAEHDAAMAKLTAPVYGKGAVDLDTRDNGLVQHGDHAE